MFVYIHDITMKKDYDRKSWYQFILLLLRFYVTSKQGIVLAELVLKGFLNIVWESVSLYEWRCSIDGKHLSKTSQVLSFLYREVTARIPLAQRSVPRALFLTSVNRPCHISACNMSKRKQTWDNYKEKVAKKKSNRQRGSCCCRRERWNCRTEVV